MLQLKNVDTARIVCLFQSRASGHRQISIFFPILLRMKARTMIFIGSLFMALAVGFGAFGAHIVQDMLTTERFQVYQTAAEYHFYHAIGILIIGILSMLIEQSPWLKWAGYLLVAGILIFCGSLYILALTDTAWLGAITPIGGVAFILGWTFAAVGITTGRLE
ncbi:MAG: DUF423 domain-containing protein [Balneolales bacterium]